MKDIFSYLGILFLTNFKVANALGIIFLMIIILLGRGTLASDILKVFNHFKLNQTTLHLVEVSPHLSEIQAKRLCGHSTFVKEQETPYRHGKLID